MIHILYKDGLSIDCPTTTDIPHNDAIKVEAVLADGEELEAIFKQFSGLPRPNGLIQVVQPVAWFGDHARFIVANLK